jgi:opacity protein-like surface antigen
VYVGTGIGLTAQMEVDGTSNVVSAQDDIVDFAWNVGTGINYQFTDKVKLAVGYRYVGLPKATIDTRGPFAPTGNDEVDYDLDVHELRVAVRVLVFEFPSPWR